MSSALVLDELDLYFAAASLFVGGLAGVFVVVVAPGVGGVMVGDEGVVCTGGRDGAGLSLCALLNGVCRLCGGGGCVWSMHV